MSKTVNGIPYIFGQIEFSINGFYEIELLHLFLIKTIKKKASITEISEAIGFSENEVREEFYNMCEYGYVEPDYKTLTGFSKDYLELVDFIKKLKPGYLDEITGVYATPKPYFVAEENPEDFEAFELEFNMKNPLKKLKLPGQLA